MPVCALRSHRRLPSGCILTWLLSLVVVPTLQADESAGAAPAAVAGARLNVLLITADDLQYDSLGVTGCKLPGITPNLDRLASQGMRFERAHVTVAVCQPCRSVLMTGRYPFHNGARGFEPIRRDVPTLGESLRAAGYFNGIFAKVGHLEPIEKYCWDVVVDSGELGSGRDPARYYRHTKEFLEKARSAVKPFFLMANSQDPHRPFALDAPRPPAADRSPRDLREAGGVSRVAGSDAEPRANAKQREVQRAASAHVRRTFLAQEVEVPCFLPDLPEVRRELASYYTSVHRCDETVGEILRALDESGLGDSTLVMFLSDNGMPFPFAKTNCYPFSTRTPWIVRWPGKVKAGAVDGVHYISGIDFLPTVLDAVQVAPPAGVDGRSFLPLLRGEEQEGRDQVLTTFHQTSGRRDFEMRAVQNRRFAYIYNAWSDGKTVFTSESTGSASFKGMQRAAQTHPAVAARVRHLSYRVPEELYDLAIDPCCQRNVADLPEYRNELQKMREKMADAMRRTGDPLREGHQRTIQ